MPRPAKTPAERVAKVRDDATLAEMAAQVIAAQLAEAEPNWSDVAQAAKALEGVGCYARRTAAAMSAQAAQAAAVATQRVTIIGPNLRDQSKGQFHVHAEGCADIAKSAKRDPEFRNGWTIEATNRVQVCDDVYPPEDFGCESGEYIGEFHFAPCVKLGVSS